jgi:hypothetical protein
MFGSDADLLMTGGLSDVEIRRGCSVDWSSLKITLLFPVNLY